MVPLRRRPKARVEALVRDAHDNGNVVVRAACLTAHRVHMLRLAAGHDEAPSEEAEAGALLNALAQHDAQILSENFAGFLESIKEG